jgi:hypothetical protein
MLAMKAREIDMRASPYDLSSFEYDAIEMETEAGRASYEQAQRALCEEARPLRARLIDALENVLAASQSGPHSRPDATPIPNP